MMNDRLPAILGFAWIGGLFYLIMGYVPPDLVAPLTIALTAVARIGVFLFIPGYLLLRRLPRSEEPAPVPKTQTLLLAFGAALAAHLLLTLFLPAEPAIPPALEAPKPSLVRVFLPQITAAFLIWIGLQSIAAERLLPRSFDRLKASVSWSAMGTALLIALLSLVVLGASAFGLEAIAGQELTARPVVFRRDLVEIAMAILCIPLCEEIIFRVGLLGWLTRFVRPGVAVVLSAVIFSLLHMQTEIFWARLLGGIFMGWVYLASGGVVAPWLLHAAMNGGLMLAPIIWNHIGG
jgi:membrane protease YdiL (CAAX protease family)